MRNTPIMPAFGKLKMRRGRKRRKKSENRERKKNKKRALRFACHKSQRCLHNKVNGERPGCMVRLTQRHPWSSPPSLKACLGALSSMPPVTAGMRPSLQSSFPTCALDVQPTSVRDVCSFSSPFCLQQHHSQNSKYLLEFLSYSSNRNLLHSLLDPSVSTTPTANFPLVRIDFLILLLLRQLVTPETRLAWNSLCSSGLECFLK